MAVGIRQVAERAGVSPGTVSNVLNRPERVAAATRLRVQAVITELGFVRNGSASTLRAGQSTTIGLMVLDLANPFFTEVARGVEDVAGERGHAVILSSSAGSREREERNLRVMAEQRVRGVLMTPVADDPARAARLRERGIPLVLLGHEARAANRCSVSVDDVLGGELAVRHLRAGGARDIALVTGPMTLRQCVDRRAGALRALGGDGIREMREIREIVVSEMNATGGEEAAGRLLAGRLPDAVFCANDLLALGLIRRLTREGVRVPGDVRVVGYDDIEFSAAATVPLTSVRQPTYRLGRAAAELLLDECDDPDGHAHQQIRFQPELVVRESARA
jgi:LacI family transcriptional regulator